MKLINGTAVDGKNVDFSNSYQISAFHAKILHKPVLQETPEYGTTVMKGYTGTLGKYAAYV